MSESVLEVEDLTRKFGDFTAVDAVSFQIGRGETFGVLGPNGAGKSTTIRMLCGVLTPTSGHARALGRDLFTQSQEVRGRMGYMSQKSSLLTDLTVAENLAFFGSLYGLSGERLKTETTHRLREMQVWSLRDQLVAGLSTGERQRVSLAAATLHEPEVLFLDEPTSGVDPLRRRLFWEAMADLITDGMTILVTTHNLAEADQCDRLAFILGGRLVACGRPAELKAGMGRRVLALRTPEYRALRAAAEKIPGVLSAVLQGRSVRLTCAEDTDPAAILGAVAALGLPFTPGEPELPSLEDFFVDLVDQDRSAREV
jgi:ABC-2 type transport system ATP-binding protein